MWLRDILLVCVWLVLLLLYDYIHNYMHYIQRERERERERETDGDVRLRLKGGEGTADWDNAASNRSTCLELLDGELFVKFQ